MTKPLRTKKVVIPKTPKFCSAGPRAVPLKGNIKSPI
jgi:hypothetical protein